MIKTIILTKIIAVATVLLVATSVFSQSQKGHARPFGINLESTTACNYFESLLSARKAESKISNTDLVTLVASSPDTFFPGAKSISASCLKNKLITLRITLEKQRFTHSGVAQTISYLREKYKQASGEIINDEEDYYSQFVAGKVEIQLNSVYKWNHYHIVYAVHQFDIERHYEQGLKETESEVKEMLLKRKSAL